MIIWTVAKTQWLRLLRNKLSRLAILAILFIPLLYCGLYLYAFWNPYGSLNKLPVALVMEDKGGMYHGKKVNYGKDLAQQLQDKIDLKWEMVSASVAQKGISGDDYYLVVKIPADFTKRSLSITSKKPIKSQLIFIRNEGKNYIAGTIASRIESEMASEVSNQFTNEYVQNILSLLVQAKSGISHAAEGADQLSAGAERLESGLRKINNALQQASLGARKLNKGVRELATGANSLANGADKVAAGTDQLAVQVNQISSFLKEIRSSQSGHLTRIKSEISNIELILTKLQTDLSNASLNHPELATLENRVKEAVNRIQTLQKYRNQLEALLSDTSSIQTKLEQIQTLNNGARQVATGANQLSKGIQQLKAGTSKLQTGLHDIQTPFPALIKGANQLAKGNKELSDKLTQATAEQQSDPKTLARIIANPIEIVDKSIYRVSLYGVGLAPYFLPLSLWIGGLMLYFAIPVSEKRWRLYPSHPWFIQIGKLLTFVPFGILQAVVTGLVIQYGLGLPIQQPLYYYLFLICISFMSIALIGVLISLLGSGPGRLVSIVLLVLQLVSSGGTFPINLIPPIFQFISPILPMSYGVNGLRHIIVYHQPEQLVKPFAMVLFYLIGSLALTFFGQKRKFRLEELKERDQLEAG